MNTDRAILTVDDDALVLVSIRHQLERHFYTEYVLEFAQSASEGLEVIDGLNQDGIKLVVIICDFFMPGMNGDEFAREVKRSYPHLEILMLTGQADSTTMERLLEDHTISGLLTKPWGEQELIAHLRAFIAPK